MVPPFAFLRLVIIDHAWVGDLDSYGGSDELVHYFMVIIVCFIRFNCSFAKQVFVNQCPAHCFCCWLFEHHQVDPGIGGPYVCNVLDFYCAICQVWLDNFSVDGELRIIVLWDSCDLCGCVWIKQTGDVCMHGVNYLNWYFEYLL